MRGLTFIKLLFLLQYTTSIEVCGLQNRARGPSFNINRFPFITSIVLNFYPNGEHLHGTAVIVSKQWALSTTDLRDHISAKLIQDGKVLLRGNTNTWKPVHNKKHLDHVVTGKYDYKPRHKPNNTSNGLHIMLLHVREPFKGRNEKPIKVAKNSFSQRTTISAMVAGWGTLYETKSELTTSEFKFKMNKKCQNNIDLLFIKSVVSNICSYDRGSPIYLKNKSVLVGLIMHVDVFRYRKKSCQASNVTYIALSPYYKWFQKIEKIEKMGITYVNV